MRAGGLFGAVNGILSNCPGCIGLPPGLRSLEVTNGCAQLSRPSRRESVYLLWRAQLDGAFRPAQVRRCFPARSV